ncbi:MAG: multidrug efflux SMR transporter [Cohaesibacter sp.]|jgi:small multidrug resistance pump|nr:multidrug efflux SMR transporter [Cohaesibacter sp.]
MNWLYLGAAIVFEVIGTSSLNVSQGFTKLFPTLFSLIAFGISFFLLSLALKTIPVGVAYAIWSGAGIVLISSIGYVLFGQHLDAAALLGLGLILAGVIVINVFSKTIGH